MNSIYDGSYMGYIGIPFNTIKRKCAAMTWTTGELTTVVFNDVKSQEIPVRPCGSQSHTESDRNTRNPYITDMNSIYDESYMGL